MDLKNNYFPGPSVSLCVDVLMSYALYLLIVPLYSKNIPMGFYRYFVP